MSYVPRPLVLFTSLLLVLGGCLSGCDLFDSTSSTGPRLEDIPGKIVYTASVPTGSDQTNQVFVTDQEGTRQLTATDVPYENARDPAWSPDGKRIAFSWNRGNGGDELYVMNADGSGKRPLVTTPTGVAEFGSEVAWAPSGDRIAFQACPVCNLGGISSQIFVADLQSGVVDTLTSFRYDSAFPTWSPDGQRIAFISNRDYVDADSAQYRTDLYVMDSDGGSKQRLTSMTASGGIWRPTGNKIAFGSEGNAFLLDLETGHPAPLETEIPEGWRGGPIDWSGSGQQLLIHSIDYPNSRFYLIDVQSSYTEQVMTNMELDSSPDWFVED